MLQGSRERSKSISPHKTPSPIGTFMQPGSVEWLEGGRGGPEDDGQVVGRIGCGIESQVWEWCKGS